jgi:preprotein translocase subunit SecG
MLLKLLLLLLLFTAILLQQLKPGSGGNRGGGGGAGYQQRRKWSVFIVLATYMYTAIIYMSIHMSIRLCSHCGHALYSCVQAV